MAEEPPDLGPGEELASQIRQRADAAGFAHAETEFSGLSGALLTVRLPSGRETRDVVIATAPIAEAFLAIPFEKYVVLADYDAICSYQDGVIEARLRSVADGGIRRLSRSLNLDWTDEAAPRVEIGTNANGARVSIGPASQEISGVLPVTSPSTTIRIEGLTVTQHDVARKRLEDIANSVLFSIDTQLGAAIALEQQGTRRPSRYLTTPKEPQFEFPTTAYDREPLTLYWYGRGADALPLAQFLAYYQTLEFYFPVYAELESRARIQNLLKDPSFDAHNDRDIGRILATAASGSPRGGAEREQLEATLRACTTAGDLREFITASNRREKFFARKEPRLTVHALRAAASDSELLEQAARRIYDIRCRIVHSKEGNDAEGRLLLPFSPEAVRLQTENELMKLLAHKALVSGSRRLT